MLKKFIVTTILFTTVFFTQQAVASQVIANIKDADPVYNINHNFGKHTIIYSDGSSAVYNADYKPLIINGSLINADVKTVNDRTLVPIRAIVENLGGKISWEDKTKKVTIEKDGTVIDMTIGSTAVKINGQSKILDAAPNIYNDYTYLPVRFVSENLGADVAYNEESKGSVIVSGVQGNVLVDQPYTNLKAISKADAVTQIKEISNKQYEKVKKSLDSQKMEPDQRVSIENGYRIIEENIKKTKVIDEISRYYVVEGVVNRFLFDKYTGALYLKGGDGASDWIIKYSPNPDFESNMFFRGYFAG